MARKPAASKYASTETAAAGADGAATKTTEIAPERLSAAVDAIMPMMVRPEMVRIMLRNLKWTSAEIAEHEANVIKAIADRFANR